VSSVKKLISGAFGALVYQVRRKAPIGWGVDAYLDLQRLLAGSRVDVVLDVGANLGETVASYRALFPAATVHAFEPFPDVHGRLAERFAQDRQVRAHNCAVTDIVGTRRFYVNRASATNSLLPLSAVASQWGGAEPQGPGRAIEVPATTLDQFCAAEALTGIDLLKMDIQGGEGMALQGAAGLLRRRAIRMICSEVLFAPLYEGQAYFCDLVAILNSHGYELFGVYNLEHTERGLGWGDAIFRPAP
jgi:FkbM family methyltransferase